MTSMQSVAKKALFKLFIQGAIAEGLLEEDLAQMENSGESYILIEEWVREVVSLAQTAGIIESPITGTPNDN